MFLHPNSLSLDNYMIYLEWRLLSNHAFPSVDITIFEEFAQNKKHIIIKGSKEEKKFIAELIKAIKGLNMTHITSKEALEKIMDKFIDDIDKT